MGSIGSTSPLWPFEFLIRREKVKQFYCHVIEDMAHLLGMHVLLKGGKVK